MLVAGGAVFALAAAVQLARFRRHNGVWLAGLASRVVLGGATTASTVYVAALAAALWAALAGAWWFVALASTVGGAGYALCGRHWGHGYRGDPETHGRPDSRTFLAILGAAFVAGLVALVVGR